MNAESGDQGGSIFVTLRAKDGINQDLSVELTLKFECNNERKDDDPNFCNNCCSKAAKKEVAVKAKAPVASVATIVEKEEKKEIELTAVSVDKYNI